ncbi:SDR family oxidoreductase [Furfurilactobacillus entadae]|uniref:SDR family oxidoreductase n=1 Tax=Furfurilactobacillus entadae TaxID=2922307 RepID=UPI0035ECC3D3
MKLTNNTILITGGTSGIGLGLAQSLDQLGNQIIVLARNADKMAAVKAVHPTFATFQADVNDVETLKGLPAWIQGHYPDLNMVINSAGVMRAHDLLDPNVTVEDLFADIDINLKGTVAVDKLLLPQLIHQKESLVVNVSSGLANLSSAAHPTYSASKAGVHMFTSALRDQLRFAQLDHVHVMELVPPLVSETNLESGSHGGRGDMKLADLVQAALKGMAGDKGRVNAGAAKMLRKAGQLRPDQTEWQFAKTSLAQYFPAGLVK